MKEHTLVCPVCGKETPFESVKLPNGSEILTVSIGNWQKANGRLVCGECAPGEIDKEMPS